MHNRVFLTPQMAIIVLFSLFATTVLNSCTVHGNLNVGCNGKDQDQLLAFKQRIEDPLKRLSSWSIEEDCCKWAGVKCDNTTGRVTELDLHCPLDTTQCLDGEIHFSILQLEFLRFLDLSSNGFKAIYFPLINSSTNLSTNLLYLDLSKNYNLHMENLEWVSRLSSLKYLNLSGIFLNNDTIWLQHVVRLSSLMELGLSGCSLNSNNQPLRHVKFTSLAVIDVSNNSFNSEIPKWLFNLSSGISYMDLSSNDLRGQIPATMLNFQQLKSLIVRNNQLKGMIPEWMGQYKHLEQLDLSNNLFFGTIPSTLGNLSSLTSLDVSFNHLNGSLPREIGLLSKLESLSMGFNSFSGILSEQSFAKLSNLKSLSLDSSDFTFDLDSHWNPPFQLEHISISYCKLGPEFPSWLYLQRSLSYLDISSSGLAFNVNDRFWSFVAKIDHLLLSDNRISGDISSTLINNIQIDLKWNDFRGRLPHLSPMVDFFDIANNSFSGPLFPLLCQSISTKHHLRVLDMSHNLLSGELTDCWTNWQSLLHVNLGGNNLTGKLPNSIGSLINLQTFRVRNNSLSGCVPISLNSCKSLWYLDLGFNDFTGNIPIWFTQLTMAILLPSNKFHGSISSHICELSSLLVLDLANNRLSGQIPKCLHAITTMTTYAVDKGLFNSYFHNWDLSPVSLKSHLEDLPMFVKGQELHYWLWPALKFVRMIDLSSNDLAGLIPQELFSLIALQSLNLSNNHLMGKIPSAIEHMKFLESLDLSRNLLSGEIPESMSNLSFLSYLNLSYNHLNGRIPLGTQLQSFDAYSYIGNPKLCGAPLPKNCTQEEKPFFSRSMEDKDGDFTSWFEMGMTVGFISAFCCVFGTLCFMRRWQHAYFQTLNYLYTIVAVRMRRLL